MNDDADWLLLDDDGITVLGVADGFVVEGVTFPIRRAGVARFVVGAERYEFRTIANVRPPDSLRFTLDLTIEST